MFSSFLIRNLETHGPAFGWEILFTRMSQLPSPMLKAACHRCTFIPIENVGSFLAFSRAMTVLSRDTGRLSTSFAIRETSLCRLTIMLSSWVLFRRTGESRSLFQLCLTEALSPESWLTPAGDHGTTT